MRGPDFTHGRCTTPEQYLALQAGAIARNAAMAPGRYAGVLPHLRPERLVAYINEGRWIVDCVAMTMQDVRCRNGCATAPAWGVACCFSCGAIYRDLTFPAGADAIVRTLARRPELATQNWRPEETLADLEAENMAHGVPVV